MPTLRIEATKGATRRVPLAPGTYSVGRHASNAIRIDDDSVSGRHCELTTFAEGPAVVRDVGSTNGTFVDGVRVGVGTLMPGQLLRLGQVVLGLEPDSAPGEPPPVSEAPLSPGVPAIPRTDDDDEVSGDTARDGPTGRYLTAVAGAFLYPIRDGAWMTFAGLTVLQGVFWVLPLVVQPMGWLLGFLAGIYVFQLGLEIIRSTANGEDGWPSGPEISWLGLNRWELLEMMGKYLLLGLVCFGPGAIVQGLPDAPFWATTAATMAGALYFPMALLAVVLTDHLAAASPTVVIPSIRRTAGPYGVVVLLLATILALQVAADWLPGRPRIDGGWRSALVGPTWGALGLYLLLVWLRVLGLFHRHHADRLNWQFQDE